jgi:hypothetical protein
MSEIMKTLERWRSDPPDWGEDIKPPSLCIIELAERIARNLWTHRLQNAAMRVVPDAEGGLVFERYENDVYETLAVLADGSVLAEHYICGEFLR